MTPAERTKRYRVLHRERTHRPVGVTCDRKRRYASEEIARATALHLYEAGRATVKRLFAYRCEFCRGWHLTKDAHLNRGASPVTAGAIYAEPAE